MVAIIILSIIIISVYNAKYRRNYCKGLYLFSINYIRDVIR